MRRLAVAVALAGLSLACGPKFPNCKNDANCKEAPDNGGAIYCLQGQCRQCGKDADCGAGKVCKDLVCADAPKPAAVIPPVPTSSDTSQISSVAGKACKSDDDCDSTSLCIRNACVKATADLPECSDVRVHFDFDKSDLKPEDQQKLQGRVRCFRNNKGLHVTIEGHADERGTEDYNLALGSKRATTVSKYLQALGVDAAQVKTLSYGFEHPVCTEHDEECWSKNRRGEVKPQK